MESEAIPLTDEARRREARRRKILENSQSRLAKLGGAPVATEDVISNDVPVTTAPASSPPRTDIIHPDPEFERDVYEQPQPPFLFGPPAGFGGPGDGSPFAAFGGMNGAAFGGTGNPADIFNMFQGLGQTPGATGENPLLSMFASMPGFDGNAGPGQPAASAAKPIPVTLVTKLLRAKLQITAIAVLTYLLAASDIMFRSHVFTLFLVWEAIELFVLKPYEKTQTSYLGIVFMFTGIPTEHSMVFMKWLKTIRKVFDDVAVFVFYFVVTHLLWQRLVIGQTFADILDVEMTQEYDRLRQQVEYEL